MGFRGVGRRLWPQRGCSGTGLNPFRKGALSSQVLFTKAAVELLEKKKGVFPASPDELALSGNLRLSAELYRRAASCSAKLLSGVWKASHGEELNALQAVFFYAKFLALWGKRLSPAGKKSFNGFFMEEMSELAVSSWKALKSGGEARAKIIRRHERSAKAFSAALSKMR